jgi:hypothetical protein
MFIGPGILDLFDTSMGVLLSFLGHSHAHNCTGFAHGMPNLQRASLSLRRVE